MNLGIFQKRIRVVLLLVLVVIVLVATVFLGQRASNYFAKATQCPVKNVSAKNVSTNSSIITWESDERTQGRVEYGTNAVSLSFTVPEATADKIHSVPLTLLTPNTIYYYLIAVGNTTCDSTGAKCTDACTPYSFTTTQLTPQDGLVEDLPTVTPSDGQISKSASGPEPTSTLTAFCQQVQVNIGKSNRDATGWAELKTYDIDDNGVINGLDIIKCQQSGK